MPVLCRFSFILIPFFIATVLSQNTYAEKLTVMFSVEVIVGQ